MQKLLVVDGSNLLFQMFFGMPERIVNKDGKAIHGTLGFVGALLKIIRMTRATHTVVMFDGEHHNPRKDLSCDYKANRPDYSQVPDEENPFTQLDDIYKALDYLKIKYAVTTDCETDDVIAQYAYTYGNDMKIVISSFDSDFFQLITENVSVLRYRGTNTVLCNPLYINQKLGILPCMYADYKSLTGDSADNIKGASKIGPKNAAVLVNSYGRLEDIISAAEDPESEMKPTIRASLLESKDRLATNYKLIKLCSCSDLPYPISELEYAVGSANTFDVLHAIDLR